MLLSAHLEPDMPKTAKKSEAVDAKEEVNEVVTLETEPPTKSDDDVKDEVEDQSVKDMPNFEEGEIPKEETPPVADGDGWTSCQ